MIFSKFVKPKWQHRNPEVRQLALESLNDPAILNEMAQHDEATEVRRAAIRKINDLSVLEQIAQHDKDPKVQEIAEQRLKQLLCCQKGDCPPLETRLTWLNDNITDPELIAYIAQYGSEVKLRLLALKKVERDGLLGDIAINDPISEVRFAAVEKITQKSTLERVMKSARNSDKRISRKAREKRDELIEKMERPVRIRAECQAICTQLESLERRFLNENSPLQTTQAVFKGLQTRWQAIAAEAEIEFQTRFSKRQQAMTTHFDRHQQALEREQALAPLRASKQALCEQMDALLIELKKLQRIGGSDEQTLEQRINALQNEWTQASTLDNPDEEKQWQARFERAYQSVQKQQQKLQAYHKISTQLEAICVKADSLLRYSQPVQLEQLKKLQARWEKVSQPDNHSLSIFSELNTRFEQCQTALQTRLQKQKEQRTQIVQKFNPLLEELETALEGGELKTAIPLEPQVRQLFKDIQALSTSPNKTLERRLQVCSDKIYKLRDWQSWGSEIERKHLCQRVEGLLETEESPEKIAELTEQAQTFWKRLGSNGYSRELWERFNHACQTAYQRYREHLCVQMEQLSSDSETKPENAARMIRQAQSTWKNLGSNGHSQALWERFNNACQLAYEPCRTHFNIKSQARDRNFFEKQSLCDRLEQFTDETNWEETNWKDVYRFVHDTEKSWQNIGPTDRRHKKVVQRRFQAAMQVIETHLNDERNRNCRHRLRVLFKVEETANYLQELIAAQEDTVAKGNSESKPFVGNKINEAIETVKKCQEQWQVTVPNSRRVEREFWKTFRYACDVVFNYRKQQQEAHKKELQVYMQTKIALCEQVEALAKDDAIENAPNQLKEFQEKWRNTKADWNKMGSSLRKRAKATEAVEDRFRKAFQQVEEQYQFHLAAKRREQLDRLKQKAAFCLELELADMVAQIQAQEEPAATLQTAWDKLPKLQDVDLETAMEQRFQQACTATLTGTQNVSEETLKEKEILCVRLEILAGIDSPPEATSTRLTYQVARLSAAMSDGQREFKDSQDEVEEIEQDWYLSHAVSPEQTRLLEQRFNKACEVFYSQL